MTRVGHAMALVVLLGVVWPAAGSAQGLGGLGHVNVGQIRFAAKESFETVVGTAAKNNVTAGGEVTGIWRGIFAGVAVTQQTLQGQRVFVHQNEVFPLGISTTIEVRPIDIAGGWRFQFGRLLPYAGAGASFLSYKERSDFAEPGENVDEARTGTVYLAGIDVQVIRFVRAGFELRYRDIDGVLGSDGVSAVYGENKLGGLALAARFSVGR